MTENELLQYRAIKNEIEDLEFRIKQLQSRELQMENTKVKGSLSCYPYIEARFNVTGPDYELFERQKRQAEELIRKRENKRLELLEKESELHDFIYTIHDSEVRQILILRFIDGHTQDEIGRKLHLDQSRISRKLNQIFKDA